MGIFLGCPLLCHLPSGWIWGDFVLFCSISPAFDPSMWAGITSAALRQGLSWKGCIWGRKLILNTEFCFPSQVEEGAGLDIACTAQSWGPPGHRDLLVPERGRSLLGITVKGHDGTAANGNAALQAKLVLAHGLKPALGCMDRGHFQALVVSYLLQRAVAPNSLCCLSLHRSNQCTSN